LESFWHQLEGHFGTKSMPFDPEVKLLRFTQGNMRICDFNQKFKQLASSLDFNENALCAVYISNINSETLDYLKKSPPIPKILNELMEKCAHLDVYFLNSVLNPNKMQIDAIQAQSRFFCVYCKKFDHSKEHCPALAAKAAKAASRLAISQSGKGQATRH
jgi:hypothetical protein